MQYLKITENHDNLNYFQVQEEGRDLRGSGYTDVRVAQPTKANARGGKRETFILGHPLVNSILGSCTNDNS